MERSTAAFEHLSHELRSPLNAVLGWVRLLRSGEVDDDARDRALELIERNALEQARLLEELAGPPPAAGSDGPTPRRKPRRRRKTSFDPTEILRGIRVMVVDDHQGSRKYAREVLRQRGAWVRSVDAPSRAFDLVATWEPDVLLSNIQMPGEDGLSLIRRLRASGEQVPAAAVTGFGSDEARRRSLAAGFQAHLSKPVDPIDLVVIVARLASLPLVTGRREAK